MRGVRPSVVGVLDIGTRRDAAATAPGDRPKLRYTDPGMRRVRLGLFAAAMATFALLYAWPFLEARVTRDRAEHHMAERPRQRPVRTLVMLKSARVMMKRTDTTEVTRDP